MSFAGKLVTKGGGAARDYCLRPEVFFPIGDRHAEVQFSLGKMTELNGVVKSRACMVVRGDNLVALEGYVKRPTKTLIMYVENWTPLCFKWAEGARTTKLTEHGTGEVAIQMGTVCEVLMRTIKENAAIYNENYHVIMWANDARDMEQHL
jgi:hypothetical protein